MTEVPSNPGPDQCSPQLDALGLARVAPFYLQVDAANHVVAVGPALAKAWAAVVTGARLTDLFDVETLPAGPQGSRCRLTARGRGVSLVLCGEVIDQPGGERLLVLRADFHLVQEMAALGLSLDDLPLHDATNELMLVRRSAQLAQQTWRESIDGLQHQLADHVTMLRLAAGGVLYIDADGRVNHCNAALENILELPLDEMRGVSLSRMDEVLQSFMVGVEPLPRVLAQLTEDVCRPSGDGLGLRLSSLQRRGEMPTRTVQLALPARKFLRIGACAGDHGALIFSFADITRETEIDRMKSEFLATAAHELRSPMVSVLGFTELLLARDYSADRRRDMLETVHRQTTVLVGLVNELLDLSRIEARRGQDFAIQRTRLLPIIEQAAATLLIPGEQRKVRLGFAAGEADAPPQRWAETEIDVDPEKLGMAITNVLSNAFKYSPQGGDVQIWVRGADLDGRPAVAVDVVDQGIGMTREQMTNLFERFWRADPNGPIPGTGLGLCMVKEIVELQSGRVDVDSLPGRGTRVSLTLPLPQGCTPEGGPERRSQALLPV